MPRSSSTLVYGRTGTGKTVQVGRYAMFIYSHYGKITRLISSDGGGWTPIQPLINVGIIDPIHISKHEAPLSFFWKLGQGFWPQVIGADRYKLVAPTSETWEKVGAYAIEGLSSVTTMLMRHALQDPNFRIPGAPKDSWVAENLDGEEKRWGFSGMGHYGWAQQRINDIVSTFHMLPVERTLWTALESKAVDKDTNETFYGPQVEGQKATLQAPQWFGDCIHLDNVPITAGSAAKPPQMELRAYYRDHPDWQTRISYPAKPRVPVEMMPELEKRYPGGYFVPKITTDLDDFGLRIMTGGIDEFLAFEESLEIGSTDKLAKWKEVMDAARARAKEATQPITNYPKEIIHMPEEKEQAVQLDVNNMELIGEEETIDPKANPFAQMLPAAGQYEAKLKLAQSGILAKKTKAKEDGTPSKEYIEVNVEGHIINSEKFNNATFFDRVSTLIMPSLQTDRVSGLLGILGFDVAEKANRGTRAKALVQALTQEPVVLVTLDWEWFCSDCAKDVPNEDKNDHRYRGMRKHGKQLASGDYATTFECPNCGEQLEARVIVRRYAEKKIEAVA